MFLARVGGKPWIDWVFFGIFLWRLVFDLDFWGSSSFWVWRGRGLVVPLGFGPLEGDGWRKWSAQIFAWRRWLVTHLTSNDSPRSHYYLGYSRCLCSMMSNNMKRDCMVDITYFSPYIECRGLITCTFWRNWIRISLLLSERDTPPLIDMRHSFPKQLPIHACSPVISFVPRRDYQSPWSTEPCMLFPLEKHNPWNHFTIMRPIVTELMPPFLQYDFILANLGPRPEIGMRLIQTRISKRLRRSRDNIVWKTCLSRGRSLGNWGW